MQYSRQDSFNRRKQLLTEGSSSLPRNKPWKKIYHFTQRKTDAPNVHIYLRQLQFGCGHQKEKHFPVFDLKTSTSTEKRITEEFSIHNEEGKSVWLCVHNSSVPYLTSVLTVDRSSIKTTLTLTHNTDISEILLLRIIIRFRKIIYYIMSGSIINRTK